MVFDGVRPIGSQGLVGAAMIGEEFQYDVALADFNNDGGIDLAATTSNRSLNIYLARPCPACLPDCDGDGELDMMECVCFLDRFAARDPRADTEHDGDWDLFDLLAYQGLFAAGCG